ncbi:MerR family transcriptional regulator [Nocardia camponoti]|uniref:HTH merR-type domain-containing protein n=1 Tax=Nocardia camponoti TaxID=1616106 RepID=A0A917V464_9NOCA|nr:MerR family transcriptional regulator [Nocardia camponoti]GGK35158.1 hypothetical protein GCM10011591_03530 [Nocardia camponoti]
MARYTRAELADVSGVAARTIRYYHTLGLLPTPERAGKEVVYGEVHRDRLRDIAAMRARGLRLDAIREVFAAETDAADPSWHALFDPRAGAAQRSALISDSELTRLLGDRSEAVAELVEAGYLERQGDAWYVPDRPMLKGALVLYDVGTDITVSGTLRTLIRERMAELADDLVDVVRAATGTGYGGEGVAVDLTRFREQFLAMAWEVGGTTLAAEVERAASDAANVSDSNGASEDTDASADTR